MTNPVTEGVSTATVVDPIPTNINVSVLIPALYAPSNPEDVVDNPEITTRLFALKL